MANKIIIADAGPLIVLGRIQLISLIHKMFDSIIITETLAEECFTNIHLPGALEIKKAVREKKIVIHKNPENNDSLLNFLDRGESSAIALALQLQANLLMDEKLGRSVAKQLNLKVIGTAGILLLAKKNKLINKIAPVLNEFKAVGYFFSDDLIQEILKRAKEK